MAIAVLAIAVYACNPAVPTVCQAYSRAEAVFIGTLLDVKKVPGNDLAKIDARFAVKRIFKGKPETIETIRFGAGDCDPQISEIGKDYFVYNDKDQRSWWIANRTSPINDAALEIEYAEGLSATKPIYTIGGRIDGLTPDELRKTTISLQNGKKKQKVAIHEHGLFSFVTTIAGSYTVKISFPFDTDGWVKVLNSSFEHHGKVLTYSLDFRPNECDFREIGVIRARPDN